MALYGASLYQSQNKESNFRYDILGKAAEAFTVGDCVSMASGVLKVTAAATDPIAGVAVKTATMANPNTTTYEGFIPADENYTFLMGTNAALTDNKTDYGTFYSITGTTGIQQVDVTGGVKTTTSRQVMIVKVDPNNVGGTDGLKQALVKFVRIPEFNGAFN
jgi:hypothetical protein